MELHQLQYVVVVAKHQNFTRAAEEICLSQPSLSQQITKLEEELGVKLFERNTRNVLLTSAGQTFLEHATRILSEIEQIHRSMQEHTGLLKGKFIIGITPVIGKLKLSALITSFQRTHTGLDIHIVEGGSCVLFEQLCLSKIDVAILTPPINQDVNLVDFYPLIDDELVLVTHSSHPLAVKGIIDLSEVSAEKFIFPNNTTGAYSITMQACHNAGFEPKIACECSQVETAMDLIKDRVGIALYSSRVAYSNTNPDISIVRLINPPRKPTVLAIRKRPHQLPAITAFRDFSLKHIIAYEPSISPSYHSSSNTI
ncbi:MAG: transcriptional regulator, LysR family [Firmicutes bacterium]|nr:transcriptional regulator, LysR family [Bacillota bacterium]